MARKAKNSLFEDLICAPWWVSLVVLIIGNIGLRLIIPAYFQASASSGPAGAALTKGIGGAMPTIANMFSLVVVIAMLFSLIRAFLQSRKLKMTEPVACPHDNLRTETFPISPERKPSHSNPASRIHTVQNHVTVPKNKPTRLTQELLNEIEWKRFETLCAAAIRELGLDPRETQYGADGGIDIVVYKAGNTEPVGIVQCKAGDNRIIGLKPVRELLGVMTHGSYKQGMFITTGSYTQQAAEFAKGRMALVTGTMLINKINSLPAEKLQRLLDIAFDGDYTTPTCPKCGIKMVVREAGKGRAAGSTFWGCPNYPKCRQTLTNKQEDD